MGCDIHLFVEKKIAGKWQAVKGVNELEVQYIEGIRKGGELEEYWTRRLQELQEGTFDYLFDGRHYLLFEVLAGVRAKHDLVPISEPKGLPEDGSPEALASSQEWGMDGHSHSWLTAAELNAYNWDQNISREGWVGVEQFKEYMEKGQPSAWSGGVGGGGVRHVSNRDMKDGIRDGFLFGDPHNYYTLIHWNEQLRDALGRVFNWSLSKLNELAGDNPEDVRIVFWFDN